jgi:predicted transcriptional regulator
MNSAIAQEQPLQKKWGSGLNSGFLLIPVLLLKRQKELLLDNTELVVLLNLLAAWWDVEKRPYPRSSTIAQRIGVTARTVQRSLEKLEKKKLILRVRHSTGTGSAHREVTSYDMAGTVERLQQLALVAETLRPRAAKATDAKSQLLLD